MRARQFVIFVLIAAVAAIAFSVTGQEEPLPPVTPRGVTISLPIEPALTTLLAGDPAALRSDVLLERIAEVERVVSVATALLQEHLVELARRPFVALTDEDPACFAAPGEVVRERIGEEVAPVLLSTQNLLIDLGFDVLALQLLQARARTETIQLAEIDMRAEWALEVARRYRHDWMNARAALVDQWRLIEFNANALKSDLTVRFEGDIRTLGGDNPLKFRDETGRLQASLEFDAPLTRLIEKPYSLVMLVDTLQDMLEEARAARQG